MNVASLTSLYACICCLPSTFHQNSILLRRLATHAISTQATRGTEIFATAYRVGKSKKSKKYFPESLEGARQAGHLVIASRADGARDVGGGAENAGLEDHIDIGRADHVVTPPVGDHSAASAEIVEEASPTPAGVVPVVVGDVDRPMSDANQVGMVGATLHEFLSFVDRGAVGEAAEQTGAQEQVGREAS
jgi:hypothetical protein